MLLESSKSFLNLARFVVVHIDLVIVAANHQCSRSHLDIADFLVGLAEHQLVLNFVGSVVEAVNSNDSIFATNNQFITVGG